MMVDKSMFSKNDGIRIALPRGNMRNALGELLARHDFVVDVYLNIMIYFFTPINRNRASHRRVTRGVLWSFTFKI